MDAPRSCSAAKSLALRNSIFFGVMMGMKLRSFGTVVGGMRAMARGGVGMVRGGFGLLVFIVLGSHAVMMGGFLVMFGRGVVMGAGGMFVRHGEASVWLEPKFTPIPRNKHVSGVLFFANTVEADREPSNRRMGRFSPCGVVGNKKMAVVSTAHILPAAMALAGGLYFLLRQFI